MNSNGSPMASDIKLSQALSPTMMMQAAQSSRPVMIPGVSNNAMSKLYLED